MGTHLTSFPSGGSTNIPVGNYQLGTDGSNEEEG